jgi:hypothetical protein
MTWKTEIIRALFVAFGTTQTLLNLNYVVRENGLDLARKQHKELPDNATNKQIRVKTICMLSFGILFFATGLFSFLTRSYYGLSFIVALILYALYAFIEAAYYRFWRTFGTFLLSVVFLILILFA